MLRLILLASAAGLAGCTTSLASKGLPADGVKVVGIPYSLPAGQATITASYQINDCDAIENTLGALIDIDDVFKITVKGESAIVDGTMLVLDPTSLGTRTKTTSLDVAYFENTNRIKSINAAATDKSAEILGSVIKTGFGIARIAMRLPPPAPGGGGGGDGDGAAEPDGIACRSHVKTSIEKVAEAVTELEAIPAKSKVLSDKLNSFKIRKALRPLTPPENIEVDAIIAEIEALESKTKNATAAIAEHKDAITYEQTYRFPENLEGTDDSDLESVLTPNEARVKSWLNRNLTVSGNVQLDSVATEVTKALKLKASVQVDGNQPTLTPTGATSTQGTGGLLYRMPATAKLIVRSVSDDAKKPYLSMNFDAPQYGRLYSLELENKFAEDNAVSATFGKNGRLLTYAYSSKKAMAESLAALGSDTVSGILQLQEAERAKDKADAAAAAAEATAASAAITAQQESVIAAAQFEIDQLRLANELSQLQSGPDPEATERARLLAELEAQVAMLRLQRERDELLNPDSP